MSSRELERVEVMGRVGSGELKLSDAGVMLELSYRQAKRLWRRYRQLGSKGLKHGNAGRPSNRSKPLKFRGRVLNLIQKKYSGSEEERFGPTLAAEHLAEEDGIVVDHDTLRRWMLKGGLWSRQRKRKKHCQRRERKWHFGELVQLDGSFHDWLEARGPRGCLMDMVDDATSETQARMGKEETIWAAAGVLRIWIGKYGVPRALYTDWKNVYKRKATPAEQLRGKVPVTQFGRMCRKLGIRIIAASSPQAKGESGADQRRASRSSDQEAAAEENRWLRGRERVSGKTVSARAQPTLCPGGGQAGGLSRTQADAQGTA